MFLIGPRIYLIRSCGRSPNGLISEGRAKGNEANNNATEASMEITLRWPSATPDMANGAVTTRVEVNIPLVYWSISPS